MKHSTETPNEACPKGTTRIYKGEVQEGDFLWDSVDGWEPAQGEIGSPVTSFKAVARPTHVAHRPPAK